MEIKHLSIKGLILSILVSLGAVAIVLSVAAVTQFREAALDSQQQSLTRIIEVGVRESFNKLDTAAKDLGDYTKKTRGFRKLAKKLIKNPSDQQLQNDMSAMLNEQYHQRYVTSGIVDLFKLRIYNKKFELVGKSSEGIAGLPNNLPKHLLSKAQARKGAERLKLISLFWLNNGVAIHSAILPVGGLKLLGYIEIALNPTHSLKHVGEILQLPLTIKNSKNKDAYKSEDWDPSFSENSLPIFYEVKDADGTTALTVIALEDMADMYKRMFDTQVTIIGLFILLISTSTLFALWVLTKNLFTPTKDLITAIKSCADGDLTTIIKPKGLKELHTLSNALAFLVNSLREQVGFIRDGADNLNHSAIELTSVIQITSDSVLNQRRETDQVATAITQMNASAGEVTNNAANAAESANGAREEAHNGQMVVRETVDAINDVETEVEKAAKVIENLQNESQNIGAVLDVIKGIADQTNLLALNAAIEAARAGEQGRGFAVVADEVRTLAAKTQQSTREIEDMVGTLQSEAHEAVSAMKDSQTIANSTVIKATKASESLAAITNAVSTISNMNTQIAVAAKEQSNVAEAITSNVVKITDMADHTSDGAKQVSANSKNLSHLAAELKDLVGHFNV